MDWRGKMLKNIDHSIYKESIDLDSILEECMNLLNDDI